ncbi:MAG: hypothetical protein ACM3XM_04140 [Mycobacterium leprae]
MRERLRKSPWLSALFAWVVAIGLVTVGYWVWLRSQGLPMRWDLLRDAALIGIPFALVNVLRDRRRKE